MDAYDGSGDHRARPIHVAIIMDGNGRWAKARGLKRTAGHRRGADAVKTAISTAALYRIPYLTLFGFSSENWRRSTAEVVDLMGLLRFYLKNEVDYLHEHQTRFRMIGERERLPSDLAQLIARTEQATADNRGLTLILALSYGGRAEIARAAQQLAREVAAGTLRAEAIDEAAITTQLYTDGVPDPDLVIRTSGEQRISNFLLWQAAYAELVFVDTLWPDFSQADFDRALAAYHRRERRFGAADA